MRPGPLGTDLLFCYDPSASVAVTLGTCPIVTSEKQRPNMAGNLLQSGRAVLRSDNRI
jgi:hypothetical protein